MSHCLLLSQGKQEERTQINECFDQTLNVFLNEEIPAVWFVEVVTIVVPLLKTIMKNILQCQMKAIYSQNITY